MSNEQTQLWKQAVEIYKDISDLSIDDAMNHIDSIHNLSYELKQAVITLVNSGNQASQYIEKNFSPSVVNISNREINYHVGDNLGEYQLLEELGKGGMSFVFKAKRKDVEPQKLVAIKIFSPKNYSSQLLEHFISEQNILSELSHPNIVDMLHGGKIQDGTTYLVMELIQEALPINDYCKSLKTRKKINYIAQCAKALAYSHANLIIHRDLKPDNILINKHGQLKIVDFGIAKLINKDIQGDKTTIMALTPSYAAPEQINSEKISTKTDIFSLAVVALELLNGEQFLPKDRLIKSCEKDEQVIDSTLKQLNIDKDLKNILHHALAQNPNGRYPSMQSFADDLDNYLNNLPVTATSQSVFYRLGKFAKRRKALFLTSMTLLASLILGLGVTLWQNKQIKLEASKAQNVKQFMLDSFSQSNPDKHAGENISAKDILDNAVIKLNKNTVLPDDVKFELLQSLGMAYDQLGFNTQAIDLLQKALKIKPNDALSTAVLTQNLYDKQQQKEVEKLLSQVDETKFSDVPQAKFAMVRARNFISQGKTKPALEILNRIEKLPMIQEDIEVMSEIIGIQAGAYFMQSDYKITEQKLLSILQRFQLPENHTVSLSTQLDLGILYNAIGEYDDSLKILQKLEKLYIDTLGDKYPELGQLYLKISSDYLAKGDLEKAEKYAQKCYDFYVSIHGKQGAQVARAMNMLAAIAKRNFNYDKTISLLEEAIEILNKTHDADYPLTLDLKNNLANNYSSNGKLQEALDILIQVRNSQIKTLGENNDATISTENGLMLVLLKMGKIKDAQFMGEKALEKARKYLPKKFRIQKEIRYNLARIYFIQKKLQKRLDLLLEIESSGIVEDTNPDYSLIITTIGQAYDVLDEVEKAESYFLKAIKASEKVFSKKHIQTLQIRLQYAKFLKYWKRTDEAKQITQEVKAIIKQENYTNATLNKWISDLEAENN